MPLTRCDKDNQKGWKWGASGTCFIGPMAKAKALNQGRAIEANRRIPDIKFEPR